VKEKKKQGRNNMMDYQSNRVLNDPHSCFINEKLQNNSSQFDDAVD
jgi:hypothetical protein